LDPLYQQLSYDFKLADNQKTLEEYGIKGGSTIYLTILDENSEEIDYSSVVYDNLHEVEIGFKGSYLHTLNGSEHDEEIETTGEGVEIYREWACLQCTFINTCESTECDACGNGRP